MTRVWIGVPPQELCDQHLRGEYNEILKYLGGLYRHPYGLAICIGHLKKQNISTDVLENRFYCVREEMLNRGFKAEKSLPFFVDWFELSFKGGYVCGRNVLDLMQRSSTVCKGGCVEKCFEC